jgi:hypothetical protein
MDAEGRDIRNQASPEDLPKALPDIKLHHGQTLWLLTELGFRGAATQPLSHPLIFHTNEKV